MAIQLYRRPVVPALVDWFEEFPFVPHLRLPATEHMIRVEEYQNDGIFTVKAELPGIDPDRDLEISVRHGVLTVHAERSEKKQEGKRSEFLYGSFSRSIQLPDRAKEEDIEATFDNGVLTVTAPVGPATEDARKIPVGKKP